MSNKNKPRIYWDENRQCYYITFFEDTECDEITDALEKFKGCAKKHPKEHDKNTNNKQRRQNEII